MLTINKLKITLITVSMSVSFALIARAADNQQAGKIKKHVVVIKDHDHEPGFIHASKWKTRGYLGIGLTDLTKPLRAHFGVPKNKGVMIDRIEEKSPAALSGLKIGDILVGVDGKPIDSSWKIIRIVGKMKKGHQAKLTIYRSGKEMKFTATIEEKEKAQIKIGKILKNLPHAGFHLELEPNELLGPYEETLEHLDEYLKDLDVEGLLKLNQLEGVIEKRVKEVEKRLQKLEKKLQSKEKENPAGLSPNSH